MELMSKIGVIMIVSGTLTAVLGVMVMLLAMVLEEIL